MPSTASFSFGLPVRRLASVAAATVLAAGPAVLSGAAPAHAAPATGHGAGNGAGSGTADGASNGGGKAGAVVLRAGLDVSLLNKAVDVPLSASLNEVHAPAEAAKTALSVTVDGVDRGNPVHVLRADVATARATADRHAARGYANLAHAKVHVPGLPLLPLIEVQQVTSKAVCEAGRKPTAASNVLGDVSVLGKKVTLSAAGTTKVEVPGVGEVRLDLSKTSTTSRTAAATALELDVAVNPLKLNVADVKGRVTLARATCETPRAATSPSPSAPAPSTPAAPAPKPQTGSGHAPADLAETGGNALTPYLAGGAALLVAAGAGTLIALRRRSAATGGRG
ncbi:SCO1860 family LAETG-anchored protein [Streptomyces sp. NPDC050617]|uniref:SCO1860 family LAETG-anchored protein n=1 Tax=Streptomyces sp. NPDC050617 TaxID=3154628 RepID=UPI003446D83C